ncbi:sulfurtransferase TusA family protein [Dethiobacter alkaliphilus]|uniref:sulfurtransferase TusA family protein n=1 Tax=Dethiobacter alkaliphilus TaxID=427926 RepID=UPI0022272184|nr:sulfurtransferase TusA family protein [Dethiobacter alkaliphilus]MCW3491255.1 sulfurtransferase TusA family protein [Dethiobacter alkaliphilus]
MVNRLDITGEVCPVTFIKVKLKLEEMEPGEQLEVLLDDGTPIKNVPKTLAVDGHAVLSREKQPDGSYLLLVEKHGAKTR